MVFWVGSKSVRSNFLHIFGVRKKIKKKNFQEKSVFIGKIGDFSPIFFSDFSTTKSFPGPPKSDFSPKNRSILAIFLSLNVIASPLETILEGRLCKIAKGEGLANPLEVLLLKISFINNII